MNQNTGLTETNRRHYLEAMGIQSWYPRVRLPAAPLPIVFDPDETEAPVPDTGPAPEVEAPPVRPTEAPAESKPVAKPQAPVEPAEPEGQSGTARRTQSSPVPRFVLSISVVGDYLITDSLARGMEQPSPAGQQLLLNILATLGVTDADVRTHHVIQWPLFTNRRVDQSVEQARLYVDEKIEQFTRQFEPKVLLSFGGVMPKLQGWDQPTGEYAGLPWVGLPSIYKMLADPRQKAVTWQRLKPLVAVR